MTYSTLVILGLMQLVIVYADPSVVFKATNVECFPNVKFAVNSTCRIKARNWNKAVANLETYVMAPLYNISIRMELFKKGYNNRYFPFLVNVEVKLCDVLSKRNFLPYGTILVKILKDYSNVNHTCPLQGNLMARDLFIDGNYFPNAPLGFYVISLNIFENSRNQHAVSVGIIKYYFQIMEPINRINKKHFK